MKPAAQITIPASETGLIRVFAVSRPMATMARALKQRPKAVLAAELLGHTVDPDTIELFALSDLTGVGLPRYLMDGYDVDPDILRADRARLEGLDGYVLLLFSSVAAHGAVTLTPHADLTLVGSYTEPKPAQAAVPIPSDAAKPYSGNTTTAGAPTRSRAGSVLTVLITLLTLLLIWWILR